MISVSDLIGESIVCPRRRRGVPLPCNPRKTDGDPNRAKLHALIASGAWMEFRRATAKRQAERNAAYERDLRARVRASVQAVIEASAPRCVICHARFAPYHSRQTTCGDPECQAENNRRGNRARHRTARRRKACANAAVGDEVA